MPTVYVVNKSAHDFSAAEEFGQLKFLSSGSRDRYAVNSIHRDFYEILSKSKPEDYILICGLTVMNCIACAIFAALHGKLNLLIFRKGSYLERNLVIERKGE
jgi:hypothetical protein